MRLGKLKRVLAGTAVALVFVSAAGAFGPGRFGLMPTEGPIAVVEGAIRACPQSPGARAGNLGGTVDLRAYTNLDPFFSPPIASQTVEPNGVYRFVVDPGTYLISGRRLSFTVVHAAAGDDVRADLTLPCGIPV